MTFFTAFAIKLRWPIIIGFIAITGLFASRIPQVEVESEIKEMLPKDVASRVNLDAIEEIFGGTDMIMVLVTADDVLDPEVLRRVRGLSRRIERVKKIDRVLSLFTLKEIRSDTGQMVVESAVLRIPENDAEREELRDRLKNNEMIYGNVLGKEYKATAIIGLLNATAEDVQILADLETAIAATPGPGEVHVAGLPFIRSQVAINIGGDMRKFMPAGLLIMLVFLFFCFRQLRGVLLPFVVVLMSIIFAIGLIVILGWKIHILTILLPVLLIAVANDYGIHIYARYQEENTPGDTRDPKELAQAVMSHLTAPVLLTGVTTIGGFLSLLAHVLIPGRQLGILAAAAVAYALLGSLLFIPAVLAVIPKAKPVRQASDTDGKLPLLERILRFNGALASTRPKAVIITAVVIAGLVSLGATRLVVDVNTVKFFPPDSEVRKNDALINENFGGSTSISIVAEGDIKDPALLAHIDRLQQKLEAMPQVGTTTSVVDMVEDMNQAMHDGDPTQNRLPDSRDAVAQYFLFYSMSGDPEDFDRLVDFPFEHALLTARISGIATSSIEEVVQTTEAHIAAVPDGPFTLVGGFADILVEVVDLVIRGQLWSLLASLVVVGILVGLLFRSVVAALLGTAPLVLAMGLLFGLMGIFGVELNHITAMLSSIMIGVGVDYTIHFLWRYRQERRAGLSPAEGIRRTLTTTGRGIIFNALSVIVGFVALLLSAFLPVNMFGFLIVVSIAACLVGGLVVLPAIVLVVRPAFLEPLKRS